MNFSQYSVSIHPGHSRVDHESFHYEPIRVSLPVEDSVKVESPVSKKKIIREPVIREIRAHLLKGYRINHPEIFKKFHHPLYIPIDFRAKAIILKKKLGGILSLPDTQIRLIFSGQVLENDDDIPLDAFELLQQPEEDDEDIFRPRMQVALLPAIHDDKLDHPETNTQENKKLMDLFDDDINQEPEGGEETLEEPLEELNDAGKKAAEAQLELQQLQSLTLEASKEPDDHFDLYRELKLIECDRFYSILVDAGYEDKVEKCIRIR